MTLYCKVGGVILKDLGRSRLVSSSYRALVSSSPVFSQITKLEFGTGYGEDRSKQWHGRSYGETWKVAWRRRYLPHELYPRLRWASTVGVALETILPNLPETPTPSPPVDPLADASFESLGLGGWSPVGLIEDAMGYLHYSLDIPWWSAIVIGTIVVRTLIFPLVIISQRNAARMNNNLPELQKIQLKMSDARERGDRLDAARHAQEMMLFMKTKELNPFKNMLVPFAQAPLFVSFFMSLREMSTCGLASMKSGGLLWFADLTVPDQFYLLPLITSATLAITIEVGTDAARLNSANLGMLKYVLRSMPIIIFPFTMNFTQAVLVYWVSTNVISLIQVSVLRIPAVRTYFNIEPMKRHDKAKLPIKDKGFTTNMKNSWTNMKLTRELEERERVDEMNFLRAGRGAVTKTYKYDPRQKQSQQPISPLPPLPNDSKAKTA